MAQRFRTKVGGEGASSEGGVPFIEVPPAVMEALGRGKRPPVVVVVNGHSWRSTPAVYGGKYYLPANRVNRTAARIEVGDEVEVTLELDTAPREVELPPLLAEALAADPEAKAAFDRLSFTNRSEHAEAIASAKQEETRARRMARILSTLRARS